MQILKSNQNTRDADLIANNYGKIEYVKELVHLGTLITNIYDDTNEIRRRL